MPHRVFRTYAYATYQHRRERTLTLRFGQNATHNRMLLRYAHTNWGHFKNRDLHNQLANRFPEAYEDYRQTGDFVPYVLYPDIDDFTSDQTRRLINTLRRQRFGASGRDL